jgi:ubiquinone/menaquinone biosynthesis C-methylase UbiE
MARILADVPLTVGEVSEVLGLPQSTVSRHLKSLRETGLLTDRKEGPRVFIGLTEPGGNGDNGDLNRVLNGWLREQPLSGAVEGRLRRVVRERNGTEDAFQRLASQWDELRFEHFGSAFHLEALASLLPRDWRVLDAGTGTGYLLPFLGTHFREVVAMDSSPAMLDLARERASRAGLENVELRPGRLEALQLGDASIDCVVAILVLRHSPNLHQALREMARVVADGGRVLIVDVGPHTMEEFRRRIGDASSGIEPRRVAAGLAGVGFDIISDRALSLPETGSPARPTRPAPELFLIAATRRSRSARNGKQVS